MEQVKKQSYEELHIVIGFVKDKEVSKILSFFPKNATYYYCKPKNFRGLDEKDLGSLFSEAGFQGDVYKSVNKAFKAAKKRAKKNDFIYVGGSNFVVAEVL